MSIQGLRPLGDYLDRCRRTTPEAFAAAHPHPFLVTSTELSRGSTKVTHVGPRGQGAVGRTYHVLELVAADPAATFIRVGRGEGSDLRIDDESISRVHASFQGAPEGWRVIDAYASSGTSVNRKRLKPGSLEEVKTGDTIRLGSIDLMFLEPADFHRLVMSLLGGSR